MLVLIDTDLESVKLLKVLCAPHKLFNLTDVTRSTELRVSK